MIEEILCWPIANGVSLPIDALHEESYKKLGIRPTWLFWQDLGIINLRIKIIYKVDEFSYKVVTTAWLVGDM